MADRRGLVRASPVINLPDRLIEFRKYPLEVTGIKALLSAFVVSVESSTKPTNRVTTSFRMGLVAGEEIELGLGAHDELTNVFVYVRRKTKLLCELFRRFACQTS